MKKVVFGILAAALVSSGCSRKEYLYLADMQDEAGYVVANRHQTRIQDDDMLKITVSCKNPELAAPFNVGSGGVRVGATGQVTTDASTDNVYRVNSDGDINFPVLGVVHVGGLSLTDASDLIRDKIIAGNYIKEPIVSIEFKNFHYTVLGAVGSNGTVRVDGDKVTILEAIANAGDLLPNADLERVAVIREADGQRKIYTVDVRSTDIFNSPAFYLAQNDIIYARPKKPRSSNDAKLLTWITVALSAVTAACSVVWATR